jgi:hypothetical protein
MQFRMPIPHDLPPPRPILLHDINSRTVLELVRRSLMLGGRSVHGCCADEPLVQRQVRLDGRRPALGGKVADAGAAGDGAPHRGIINDITR